MSGSAAASAFASLAIRDTLGATRPAFAAPGERDHDRIAGRKVGDAGSNLLDPKTCPHSLPASSSQPDMQSRRAAAAGCAAPSRAFERARLLRCLCATSQVEAEQNGQPQAKYRHSAGFGNRRQRKGGKGGAERATGSAVAPVVGEDEINTIGPEWQQAAEVNERHQIPRSGRLGQPVEDE
jgi:hypothetical protein